LSRFWKGRSAQFGHVLSKIQAARETAIGSEPAHEETFGPC
jgi:hypothetical protein